MVSSLSPEEEVVDASNLILGRMASYVAKQALEGKKMVVLNAERAIISGTKARVVARAKTKLKTRTLGSQDKLQLILEGLTTTSGELSGECFPGRRLMENRPS